MTRAPLIGMTMWRRHMSTYLSERTDLYTLGNEYVDAVTDAGADVVLLPEVDAAAAARLTDVLDGIVIAGGGDVWPGLYGGTVSQDEIYDRGRDASEIELILAARAANLPVLGICRGLQIGVVALGGTLFEEIATTEIHPGDLTGERLTSMRHHVRVTKGSRIAAAVGTEALVNSIHHQAARDLPGTLRAVAMSDDGVIEAVESVDDWNFTAVQWHPEKMLGAHEHAHRTALFEQFVAATCTGEKFNNTNQQAREMDTSQ